MKALVEPSLIELIKPWMSLLTEKKGPLGVVNRCGVQSVISSAHLGTLGYPLANPVGEPSHRP
jgi:hypothetical protein